IDETNQEAATTTGFQQNFPPVARSSELSATSGQNCVLGKQVNLDAVVSASSFTVSSTSSSFVQLGRFPTHTLGSGLFASNSLVNQATVCLTGGVALCSTNTNSCPRAQTSVTMLQLAAAPNSTIVTASPAQSYGMQVGQSGHLPGLPSKMVPVTGALTVTTSKSPEPPLVSATGLSASNTFIPTQAASFSSNLQVLHSQHGLNTCQPSVFQVGYLNVT
ncbi:unnamed protein product, partial [Protopolystoma xenopodis]